MGSVESRAPAAAAMLEHKGGNRLYLALVRMCGGKEKLQELAAVADGPPQKPNAAHANTIIRR
jgi:hypothetical protein